MKETLVTATAQTVASYVGRNEVSMDQLPDLIDLIGRSLLKVGEMKQANESKITDVNSIQDTAFVMEQGKPTLMPKKNINVGPDAKLPGRVAGNPAVSVEEFVQDDYLICLEDGKKLKMLKRHLKSFYDMTPEEYRRKWNLPKNYPMVCKNYSQRRSELAKDGGLGLGSAAK